MNTTLNKKLLPLLLAALLILSAAGCSAAVPAAESAAPAETTAAKTELPAETALPETEPVTEPAPETEPETVPAEPEPETEPIPETEPEPETEPVPETEAPEPEPALPDVNADELESYRDIPGLYRFPGNLSDGTCCAVEDRLIFVTFSDDTDDTQEVELTSWDPSGRAAETRVSFETDRSEDWFVRDGRFYFAPYGTEQLVCFDSGLQELGRTEMPGFRFLKFYAGDNVYFNEMNENVYLMSFGEDGSVSYAPFDASLHSRSIFGVDAFGRLICSGVDRDLNCGMFAFSPDGTVEVLPTFGHTEWVNGDVNGMWTLERVYSREEESVVDTLSLRNLETGEGDAFSVPSVGVYSLTEDGKMFCAVFENEPEPGMRVSVCDTDGAVLAEVLIPGENEFDSNVSLNGELHTEEGTLLLLAVYDGHSVSNVLWKTELTPGAGQLASADLAELDATPSVFGSIPELEDCYERAYAITEKYGIPLYVGDAAPETVGEYTVEYLTDPETVRNALDEVEKILSYYPENFFPQLAYGPFAYNAFCIVSNLTTDSDYMISTAGGVVTDEDGRHVLAITYSNWNEQFEVDLNHEISHLIDRRLAYRSDFVEDAVFNEETWNSYNPEGFEYTSSYVSYWENDWSDYEAYFMDDYAMTYPTEDRARLFGEIMSRTIQAMSGTELYDSVINEGPMRFKLEYYAAAIRDGFNTDGWPETTSWEVFY